jgi:hypothetical protein
MVRGNGGESLGSAISEPVDPHEIESGPFGQVPLPAEMLEQTTDRLQPDRPEHRLGPGVVQDRLHARGTTRERSRSAGPPQLLRGCSVTLRIRGMEE